MVGTQTRKKNNVATWRCNGPETRPAPFTNLGRRAAAEEIITSCHLAGCCLRFPTSPFLLVYRQRRSFSLLAASRFLDRNFIYLFYIEPWEKACLVTIQRHGGAPRRVAARLLCSLLLALAGSEIRRLLTWAHKVDGNTPFWGCTQLFLITVQCHGHENSFLRGSSVKAAWVAQQAAIHIAPALQGR